MHQNTPDFMELFSGYTKAYGTYNIVGPADATGKRKGRAATIKKPITPELWSEHLLGNKGLGIIPINEKSCVRFGAIDVDEYPLDLGELHKKVSDANLPLFICRTKSGGAHLYMFANEWVPASVMQDRLRVFAAFLGYGNSEIFPRQASVLEERGDIGQWINMPYFGADRHGMGLKSVEFLPPGEFVREALENRVTLQQIEEQRLPVNEVLPGGPPCLQTLIAKGFPPGTRNNGLFCLGVYAKKSNPDHWQKLVEEYNGQFMDPPLSPTEVLGVIKSLNKKEFCYMCKQQPIVQYCNAERCRTMEYGVGGGITGWPKLGSLTKICTDPPLWFIDIEGGGRLQLRTEDLQNPRYFQLLCMSVLNVMPAIPKQVEWEDIVRRLLTTVVEVQIPPEATPKGQMMQHLEDFCTGRVQANSKDDILLGKPWTDQGRTYFRIRDFFMYLDRQKFKLLTLQQVTVYLKDYGAEHVFFNLKGRGANVIHIPEFKKQTDPFDVPNEIEPPI